MNLMHSISRLPLSLSFVSLSFVSPLHTSPAGRRTVSAYRESRTKSPNLSLSLVVGGGDASVYAAIGALCWSSLECARSHRNEVDRACPPRPVLIPAPGSTICADSDRSAASFRAKQNGIWFSSEDGVRSFSLRFSFFSSEIRSS